MPNISRISRLLSSLLAALLMANLSNAAFADPPARVGWLADVQGPVWRYDADAAEWVAAERNRPVTTGDRLATDGAARAEVRIGSTSLRLAGATDVELLQLDDDIVRVQLHGGLMALRLRTHEAAREVELVTAEGRFTPERAGRYRLDRVDAVSSITVWSGQLLFEAPDNAVSLFAGQRAEVWNDGRSQYTLIQPQEDAFDQEVVAGELADERSVSATYVSPEMTGGEDLDRYGSWQDDPEYGALWVPRVVAPGWAPYRFGHWAWVRPWGWTWVDDAPWGFAPFHYGRWVHRRNAWCWAPGRWVARPVYAPALVAWVGSPGLSVSIGIGSAVGWFPLAPREVYIPGYRTSPQYVRNVNVTQVTNIRNVTEIVNNPNAVVERTSYRNRGVPGAMTVVPSTVVSGRQPVAPARIHLTDPRPGAGGERGSAAAPSARIMAAPEIQAPARTYGNGAGFARPGAPSRAGIPAAGGGRPNVGSPAAAPSVTTAPPAPRSGPPAPAAQPVIRAPKRGADGRNGAPPVAETPRPAPSPAAAPAPRRPGHGPAPGPSAGTQESAGTPSVRPQPGRGQAPGPSAGTQVSAGTPSVRPQPSHSLPPQANVAKPVPAAAAAAAADLKASPAPAPRVREPREDPREKGKADK